MKKAALKEFLDRKVEQYNLPYFIEGDPISIPHRFTLLQDREVSGFFAAVLAWGTRSAIINSAGRLMELMDNAPYDFILHHQEKDLRRFLNFRYRTFNATDLLYFISFFREYYSNVVSIESAFSAHLNVTDETVEKALKGFYKIFFAGDHPERTQKHISTPAKNSACKRLNMFLRWMVRSDHRGVDFGVWRNIAPSQLVCPMDVHVARVAHRFGLTASPKVSWKNAVALTDELRKFDPSDPVKYDFALFGLGIAEKFI